MSRRKWGMAGQAGWLLEEAPHRERPGCGVGRGNTMSGLSGRQKWEWLGTTSITFSGEEDLVCMYWRDPPLASAPSPGTNLGADTQGPGAKGQTAPGVGPDPPSPSPHCLNFKLDDAHTLLSHIFMQSYRFHFVKILQELCRTCPSKEK